MRKILLLFKFLFGIILFESASTDLNALPINLPTVSYSMLLAAPHAYVYFKNVSQEEFRKAALISGLLIGAKLSYSTFKRYFAKEAPQDDDSDEDDDDKPVKKPQESKLKKLKDMLSKIMPKSVIEYKNEILAFSTLIGLAYLWSRL